LKIDLHGWLNEPEMVERKPSPNQNERPADTPISLLVIHNISLPPGVFGGQFIEDFFLNKLNPDQHPYFASIADQKVSAHLLIKRSGEIVQFVSFQQRAWHAGVSCFNDDENCNNFSIGIELEGTDQQPYEQNQYLQLAAVASALIAEYPEMNIDRMVGHSDIAPTRKTDPGSVFDWHYFKSLVAEHSQT
jgi:AmpD protein